MHCSTCCTARALSTIPVTAASPGERAQQQVSAQGKCVPTRVANTRLPLLGGGFVLPWCRAQQRRKRYRAC